MLAWDQDSWSISVASNQRLDGQIDDIIIF